MPPFKDPQEPYVHSGAYEHGDLKIQRHRVNLLYGLFHVREKNLKGYSQDYNNDRIILITQGAAKGPGDEQGLIRWWGA